MLRRTAVVSVADSQAVNADTVSLEAGERRGPVGVSSRKRVVDVNNGLLLVVGLSPTGKAPVTDYWASWDEDAYPLMESLKTFRGDWAVQTGATAPRYAGALVFDDTWTPDEILTHCGLQRYQEPDG